MTSIENQPNNPLPRRAFSEITARCTQCNTLTYIHYPSAIPMPELVSYINKQFPNHSHPPYETVSIFMHEIRPPAVVHRVFERPRRGRPPKQ